MDRIERFKQRLQAENERKAGLTAAVQQLLADRRKQYAEEDQADEEYWRSGARYPGQ